ncbi:MAG: sigma-70 family RNA polymerase sigma factor [Bacteroidales bacterium]|nr:sigma-70 family RNA polymerase sigma factor [Bacteroidales bacterium]MCF8334863.1 sigma-70 family RNA polymerase sigma factor [Bacteroidales bacterium]
MEVNPHLTQKARKDYELIRKALYERDQQAYARLMQNYREALYYMMLKMTDNKTDAEDLTVEAFGKAFNNLHHYSPRYAFSTWLFRIASNNCIDFIRKKRKQAHILHESEEEEAGSSNIADTASTNLSPEEFLLKQENVKNIQKVVDKLKPHYRTLVQLRYFQEYSYEEIAYQMDLPIGTVKAQLYRAREFLYSLIKGKK